MPIVDASVFSTSLLWPTLVLVALAWIIPTQVAKRMPETFRALFVNLLFSASALWGASAFGFALSYAVQGVPFAELLPGATHFIRLGLMAGMLWGPILLLALAMEPQKWRPEL